MHIPFNLLLADYVTSPLCFGATLVWSGGSPQRIPNMSRRLSTKSSPRQEKKNKHHFMQETGLDPDDEGRPAETRRFLCVRRFYDYVVFTYTDIYTVYILYIYLCIIYLFMFFSGDQGGSVIKLRRRSSHSVKPGNTKKITLQVEQFFELQNPKGSEDLFHQGPGRCRVQAPADLRLIL